jgi:hypothetical protein
VEITDELKTEVLQNAGRRCECEGPHCRHHRKGGRCKHALRDGQWKVYWRTEGGAAQRWNLEGWCLTCFDNNFEIPSS